MNKIYILPTKTDTYSFVKQIAAKKYNISAQTLEIGRDAHGKPFFKNLPNFHFNVSHSNKLQAIAVCNSAVGVDIEKLRTPDLRVAKRFCENEYAYITEKDSKLRFFEIWTKKEAYLKYKGTGLSGGLKSFSIFSPDTPIKTYFLDGYTLSVCGDGDFEIIKIQ